MTDSVDAYSIDGRSAGATGHGSMRWQLSIRELAEGPSGNTGTRPFKGRPELAREVSPALRQLTNAPLSRASFKTYLLHLQAFWKFLDEMEVVSSASGGKFVGPSTVLEIPGVIWGLFKDWLDAQPHSGQHYAYFHCKRIFDLSASVLQPAEAVACGYPLPINPYPNILQSQHRFALMARMPLSLLGSSRMTCRSSRGRV